jgi:predicted signal transduction protein with EAL and GGDEF domain
VRANDTIARLGGDEFAILLPPPSGLSHARSIAERVLEAVRQPFEVMNGLRLEVGISIGVALAPKHADDEARLMQCADVAMYAAKRGTASIQFYDPMQDQNTVRHLTLSGALRQAIEGGELSFLYQPKLDLGRGTIACVEALARWQHPVQGTIMPDEFIRHAERTGLIEPFTRWTFDTVLAQMASWQARGIDIGVALNLSARSLHDQNLPEMVRALLDKWQVVPERLTIEITESAVMHDPEGASRILDRLHGLGLRLSIDDFGTGYSSLSHLQRLPLDELKIDKSFVIDMGESEQGLVIVRSTIELAHNLGLTVVAEGIETERHLELLQEMGCDLGQGFLVSRPLTAERIDAWCEHAPGQFGQAEAAPARPAPKPAPSRERVALPA